MPIQSDWLIPCEYLISPSLFGNLLYIYFARDILSRSHVTVRNDTAPGHLHKYFVARRVTV
jgi:hypothetical protein